MSLLQNIPDDIYIYTCAIGIHVDICSIWRAELQH